MTMTTTPLSKPIARGPQPRPAVLYLLTTLTAAAACSTSDSDGETDATSAPEPGSTSEPLPTTSLSGSGTQPDDSSSTTGQTPGSTTGDSSSGDTTSSDGSGSESSTGAPPEVGLCPLYSGLGPVGSTWDSEFTDEYIQQTGLNFITHFEVVEVIEGPPTIVVAEQTVDYVTNGLDGHDESEYRYQCDADGASFVSRYTVQRVAGQIIAMPSIVYDPPRLRVPWGLEVGSQWSSSTTATQTDNTGQVTVTEFEIESEVTGESTAPVLGEDQPCLLVTTATSMGTTSESCIHATFGAIDFENTEFTAIDILPW